MAILCYLSALEMALRWSYGWIW